MSNRLVTFTAAAVAVIAIAAGFGRHLLAGHGSLPAPDRLTLQQPKVAVPLTFVGGRPVVDVKVNGKGPYRFIFDTGATGTVISNDLAKDIGLPALQHAMMGRPGSNTPLDAYVTKMETLDIGAARAEGVAAVYSDLSLLKHISKGDGAPVGVLSAVNFPGWIVSIDFAGAQLQIEKGELPATGAATFEWNDDETIPTVPLKLAKLTVRAHVDCGSGSGITLATNVADKLPLTERRPDKEPAKFVDSQFPVTDAKLDAPVSIGDLVLNNPSIRYHDGSAPANIGQEVLKNFVLRIDAKNRRIQFVRQ